MIKESMIARIFACIILLTGLSLFSPHYAYAQWGGGPSCDVSNPDADNDGDGLTNGEEQQNGTDACDPDTDNDDLPDQPDAQFANPLVADTDADGLTDGQEFNVIGTDPALADTDDDGLLDGPELNMGFDALNPDMDNDGLRDGEEVDLGTDARHHDTDRDGVADFDEVMMNLNPTVADSNASIQAACNAMGSENSMVVCNAFNSGNSNSAPTLNKDTQAQGTEVKGCASAGSNTSGMPSYFILIALVMMANFGLRQRKEA